MNWPPESYDLLDPSPYYTRRMPSRYSRGLRSRYQWPDGKWRWKLMRPGPPVGYWVAADMTSDGIIPNRTGGVPLMVSGPVDVHGWDWKKRSD